LKRNSGFGALVSSSGPTSTFVTLSGNVFLSNLGGSGIHGSGLVNVAVSANTTLDILVACNGGTLLYTFQNNPTIVPFATTGCAYGTYSLK
jgi:hypothetical protein